MRYTVVLEREEDGGYVASVPALPGCVSQGDDRAQVLTNIREAIELYVEDCKDAGDPVPPPKLDELTALVQSIDNVTDEQLYGCSPGHCLSSRVRRQNIWR